MHISDQPEVKTGRHLFALCLDMINNYMNGDLVRLPTVETCTREQKNKLAGIKIRAPLIINWILGLLSIRTWIFSNILTIPSKGSISVDNSQGVKGSVHHLL